MLCVLSYCIFRSQCVLNFVALLFHHFCVCWKQANLGLFWEMSALTLAGSVQGWWSTSCIEFSCWQDGTKYTREGKMRHSAAGWETGSTASAKDSGHSVGKTTHCCQWQSLTCCRRLISGVCVIRGYLKDASHKNKRPIHRMTPTSL